MADSFPVAVARTPRIYEQSTVICMQYNISNLSYTLRRSNSYPTFLEPFFEFQKKKKKILPEALE